MVFFLYLAAAIAFSLGFTLIRSQFKKLMKKDFTTKSVKLRLVKGLFADTLLIFLIIITITFLLPSLIWTAGTKVDRVNDIIIDKTELSPISESNKKIYVKESTKDGEKVYIVNGDKTLSTFDANSTELIEVNSIKNPEYILVNQYNIKQLKGDNIFIRNINDMYANIYLNKDKGTLIGTKVKIYVPKNSLEK